MPKLLIPNSTQIPNLILDFIIPQLPEAEARCLLYICRRTYGFHKQEDEISLSQFISGPTGKNGKLDLGCGLSNRTAITDALDSLEKLSLISVKRAKKGNLKATNTYTLNLRVKPENYKSLTQACEAFKKIRREIRAKRPKQARLFKKEKVDNSVHKFVDSAVG